MKGMGAIVLVALVLAALMILSSLLKAQSGDRRKDSASFKPKRLLTPNELEFLARLEAAAPELRFCPQVAMGALLEPSASRSDSRNFFRQRGMFAQKIVDFVVQRREDGSVMAIIELDDRTHDADKDARRDAMLSSAGYRVIRWQSKHKPDIAAIRAALFPPSPQTESETFGLTKAALLTQDGDAARIEPTLVP